MEEAGPLLVVALFCSGDDYLLGTVRTWRQRHELFYVVRNGLHGYQWRCSHLATKTKLYIGIVVNGTHFQ